MRQGFIEKCILPLVLIRPFRCQNCAYRYFGLFFAARVVEEKAEEQPPDDLADPATPEGSDPPPETTQARGKGYASADSQANP